jgi:hypothetical protein
MSDQLPSIDAIVAEVLARLRETLASQPPAAPGSQPSHAAPAPTEPASAGAEPAARPPSDAAPEPAAVERREGDLVLEDRVVTLSSLDGRWDQTRRLVLTPNAVLTPSVKDELRKRRVRVEYRAADVAPPVIALACCTHTPHAGHLAARLAASVPAQVVPAARLVEAVRELAQWVVADHRLGVLLTDDPLSGVCLANRRQAVRAAWPRCLRELPAVITAIGANVLVVDPLGVTTRDFERMVEMFQQDLPRRCPPHLGDTAR